MSQEIVFCSHEESHIVMSEKVQSLAGSIYQEFERMISKYDEEVVKNLMPLVVNVLECLDLAYMENQEHEVELELLREDNEQLITQYEREKQLRKSTEQKLLEMEDNVEDEQKMLCSKIESLESIVRMFELKFKNSSDHVNRLEEKEQDMKKEYSKLHERYTELFKTHMEHIERTKNLLSTADKAENTARSRNSSNFVQFNRSSGPVSFGFSSLEPASTIKLSSSPVEFSALSTSPLDSCQLTIDVDQRAQSPQEISEATGNDKMGWSETISVTSKDASPDEISEDSPPPTKAPSTPAGRSTTQSERRSANTLYQELSFQDSEVLKEVDDGADIAEIESESETQPSSVNDAFFGMGKEIENLILENNELLATKNALNIVKDDLIAKVDELTSEQEILREEVRVLTTVKTKLKRKIVDLEDELRKVKEEAEKFKKSNVANEDEDVPMAQRKRFTRMEMARVLTERNQYKEKFMELQEAIKWTELVRANKSSPSNGPVDKKNKQTFWKFFSGLFSGSSEENPGAGASFYPSGTHLSNPVYNMNPSMESFRKKQIQDQKRSGDFVDLGSLYSEKVAARRANERKEQFRQVRAHVSKEDGRVQVYGWSLPAKQSSLSQVSSSQSLLSSPPQVPVPVPVYCRPLEENEPGVKIWCATGVVLNNDLNFPNSQNLCDSNVNLRNLKSVDHFSSLDSAISDNSKDLKISESKLDGSKINDEIPPSLVWICTSTHSISKVTILNANNPADILASFSVCSSILLCIASVTGDPGIDPGIDPENERIPKVETEELNLSENSEETLLGKILYITDAENSKIKNEISSNASSNQTISDNQNAEKKVNAQHTIWLGSKDGSIFVHSAVSQWKQCLYSTRLKDSVLNILPISGRVFCALADGTIAVFKKGEDHQWDLSKYYLLVLGPSQHSVKCLLRVYENIWASSKNNIHIIDPVSLVIKNSFVAHPRKDSQVRQMVWTGDGVWVSIRLDSTLRLYHAQTLDHLQDVDVEPYVSKMLGTGKLGFSLIKITALLISCQRLWIGTGNGVIISVPLSQRNVTTDGSAVNQDESTKTDVTEHPSVTNSKFIPYCNMAQAQLSFHGYRDAVKFFVAVPGLGSVLSKTSSKEETPVDHITSSRNSSSVLILSGGEGYIDFRIGESSDCSDEKFSEEKETSSLSLREKNHLIVWQVIEGDQIRN